MLNESLAPAHGALRRSALVATRNARRRIVLSGEGAAQVLNGLVTNEVASLAPGTGTFAAALTAKGKIIADLRIFRLTGKLLIDTGPRAGDGLWAMIRKYVNPRLASYEDVTDRIGDVSVFGPRAAEVTGAAVGLAPALLRGLPHYSQLAVDGGPEEIFVARIPDLDVEGYALFSPLPTQPVMLERLVARGAVAGNADAALEIARIETGRPEWGVDMDESTLVQEANLDELQGISYTKGCYTGQETVARLHFRGHVNKLLRRVEFDGSLPLPMTGTELRDPAGAVVGTLRSVIQGPAGGIGIAMIRREVEPGGVLEGSSESGPRSFTVLKLPYQSA